MIVDKCFQNNDPPGELGKRHGADMPGGRLNKLFLGPESGGTEPRQEDIYAGQAIPVSYTHLDVYKRQSFCCTMLRAFFSLKINSTKGAIFK